MNYDNTRLEQYNILETTKNKINEYINSRTIEINRINLAIERNEELRDSLPIDEVSRDDIIAAYNKSIASLIKERESILDPSKEERSKILNESTQYIQEIYINIRNIKGIITEVQERKRVVEFEFGGLNPLDENYYKLKNEIEAINGLLANLNNIIKEYEELIPEIKEYVDLIFEKHTQRLQEIVSREGKYRSGEQPSNTEDDNELENDEDTKSEDDDELENDEDTKSEDDDQLENDEDTKSEDNYATHLEMYEKILEIYNEALERLYELQLKYENGQIEYEEYAKFADYMVERYRFILSEYNKVLELYNEKKQKEQEITDEDRYWYTEVANGEIPYEYDTEKIVASIKPEEPIQPTMIKKIEKIVEPTKEKTYEEMLDEYEALLDMYYDDLERLYELQLKYENGQIEYEEYEKFADYMVERYKFISNEYNKVLELYNKKEKEFDYDEYYHRTHIENGVESHTDDNDIKPPKKPEKPEQPMMIMEKGQTKKPEEKTKGTITLESVIAKIIGKDKDISESQCKSYSASQIVIYSKIPKNNRGNGYKLVSAIKNIFGVIISVPVNAVRKLVGKIITTEETELAMEDIKNNLQNLSDEEIEILIDEYKNSTALEKKYPKALNDLILARITQYLMEKINKINKRIAELLVKIDYHKKIADRLEKELQNPELSQEEFEKITKLKNEAYQVCADEIIKMKTIKKEGNNLSSGAGLHSLQEDLRAVGNKMNYKGARYSTNTGIQSDKADMDAELADIIKNSNDPKAIVDAYFEQKQMYIDNTTEKRSLLNLGSKVSTGAYDYRPFVENLYYGNDPFISDLVTSIITISSIVNLVDSVMTSAKNAKALEQIQQQNEAIMAHNKKMQDLQKDLTTELDAGSKTIQEGLIYGARKNTMDGMNIAERGNLDATNWSFNGTYKAEDLAQHADASNFSTYIENEIAAVNSELSSGTISQMEATRRLQQIYADSCNFANQYASRYLAETTKYANSHTHDYSSILRGLTEMTTNPNAPQLMQGYLIDLYEKAYNLLDFQDLSTISVELANQSIIPTIVTTAGLGAKVAIDNENEKKANSTEWDKEGDFTELVERVKKGNLYSLDEIEEAVEESKRQGRIM